MKKKKATAITVDQQILDIVNETDHKTLVIWAADCAQRVLPYFTKIFPEDNRPQTAIAMARGWIDGEVKTMPARKAAFASHTAARNTGNALSARSAARSAGHAAATTHVAKHASLAAAYAIAARCDASESASVDALQQVVEKERAWQYEHLLTLKY